MAEEQQSGQERMHPSFINTIRQKERVKEKLSGIKHKIGIYSAKGGVGKTTVAVNIAYALKDKGFKVGLLDADIDCPNVTIFLGIGEKMVPQYPLRPIVKDGIKIASTAMVIDEIKKPIIWRGALITKMLGDFFENTDWGELDYLIIDLPPGTSDAPLTVMQLLDMEGFVIVTTPQKVAAINSIRSGLMAKRLGMAILGVVENMSSGKESANTQEVAKELNAEVLGTVKSSDVLREAADAGSAPLHLDRKIEEEFLEIAKKLAGR